MPGGSGCYPAATPMPTGRLPAPANVKSRPKERAGTAGPGPEKDTMNRIAALVAALVAAVTVVVFGAALSASAATVPVPGIGASLWGTPSDRLTVAPGTSRTIWTAFYSTGPAETATLSVGTAGTGTGAGFAAAAAGYISLSTATVS